MQLLQTINWGHPEKEFIRSNTMILSIQPRSATSQICKHTETRVPKKVNINDLIEEQNHQTIQFFLGLLIQS